MKVAYMMGSLNRGGAETLMLDVFRNTQQTDLNIIGIHRNKGDLYKNFSDTKWPLYQIRPNFKIDVLYLIRLRRFIIKRNISIIHAQQPVDGLYAMLATFTLNVKLVLTLHSFNFEKKWWYRIILKYLLVKYNMLLFVSKTQMAYYRNTYYSFPESRYRIMYNSIDLNKFYITRNIDIRNELEISNRHLLFGSVGNFNSVRDQFTICRALKLLKDKHVNFSFIFIGARQAHNPSLFEKCVEYCDKNELSQQVFFLGLREDVPSLLKQMDAFIYSSNHDTFGIAVIEAMINGTPVIVNDWSVMLEITRSGQYAEIYKSGNPIDLYEKIQNYIHNPTYYKNKAENQKAIISGTYDIKTYMEKLNNIYESIL